MKKVNEQIKSTSVCVINFQFWSLKSKLSVFKLLVTKLTNLVKVDN